MLTTPTELVAAAIERGWIKPPAPILPKPERTAPVKQYKPRIPLTPEVRRTRAAISQRLQRRALIALGLRFDGQPRKRPWVSLAGMTHEQKMQRRRAQQREAMRKARLNKWTETNSKPN